jgi:putative hydrolase of the HAD superfamily
MAAHPVETLPHARETLAALSGDYRLVLITKGDLFDQERKLAQSGLGDFFHAVEIVSDKKPDTYDRIFARHGDGAGQAMMVGNSLKSDILPALEAGSWAVHVPHELTWVLEHAAEPVGHGRYHAIPDLGPLRSLIEQLVR